MKSSCNFSLYINKLGSETLHRGMNSEILAAEVKKYVRGKTAL